MVLGSPIVADWKEYFIKVNLYFSTISKKVTSKKKNAQINQLSQKVKIGVNYNYLFET